MEYLDQFKEQQIQDYYMFLREFIQLEDLNKDQKGITYEKFTYLNRKIQLYYQYDRYIKENEEDNEWICERWDNDKKGYISRDDFRLYFQNAFRFEKIKQYFLPKNIPNLDKIREQHGDKFREIISFNKAEKQEDSIAWKSREIAKYLNETSYLQKDKKPQNLLLFEKKIEQNISENNGVLKLIFNTFGKLFESRNQLGQPNLGEYLTLCSLIEIASTIHANFQVKVEFHFYVEDHYAQVCGFDRRTQNQFKASIHEMIEHINQDTLKKNGQQYLYPITLTKEQQSQIELDIEQVRQFTFQQLSDLDLNSYGPSAKKLEDMYINDLRIYFREPELFNKVFQQLRENSLIKRFFFQIHEWNFKFRGSNIFQNLTTLEDKVLSSQDLTSDLNTTELKPLAGLFKKKSSQKFNHARKNKQNQLPSSNKNTTNTENDQDLDVLEFTKMDSLDLKAQELNHDHSQTTLDQLDLRAIYNDQDSAVVLLAKIMVIRDRTGSQILDKLMKSTSLLRISLHTFGQNCHEKLYIDTFPYVTQKLNKGKLVAKTHMTALIMETWIVLDQQKDEFKITLGFSCKYHLLKQLGNTYLHQINCAKIPGTNFDLKFRVFYHKPPKPKSHRETTKQVISEVGDGIYQALNTMQAEIMYSIKNEVPLKRGVREYLAVEISQLNDSPDCFYHHYQDYLLNLIDIEKISADKLQFMKYFVRQLTKNPEKGSQLKIEALRFGLTYAEVKYMCILVGHIGIGNRITAMRFFDNSDPEVQLLIEANHKKPNHILTQNQQFFSVDPISLRKELDLALKYKESYEIQKSIDCLQSIISKAESLGNEIYLDSIKKIIQNYEILDNKILQLYYLKKLLPLEHPNSKITTQFKIIQVLQQLSTSTSNVQESIALSQEGLQLCSEILYSLDKTQSQSNLLFRGLIDTISSQLTNQLIYKKKLLEASL